MVHSVKHQQLEVHRISHRHPLRLGGFSWHLRKRLFNSPTSKCIYPLCLSCFHSSLATSVLCQQCLFPPNTFQKPDSASQAIPLSCLFHPGKEKWTWAVLCTRWFLEENGLPISGYCRDMRPLLKKCVQKSRSVIIIIFTFQMAFHLSGGKAVDEAGSFQVI